MKTVKYPRTFHLPWSLGLSDDDKAHKDVDALFAGQQVVVTEKLDGENTTLYSSGHTHARSMDSVAHPSRSWVKALAATVSAGLPEGWRICGENVFAKHSVAYKALPSYFLVFGIYDENNVCLSWRDTEDWCAALGLQTVPVLYEGLWDEVAVRACHTGVSSFGGEQEGYVVRITDAFQYEGFRTCVAKFVRKGHVQTDTHWMQQTVVPNRLQE